MNAYIDTLIVSDENGAAKILYPKTKLEAVFGLIERLGNLEVPQITESTETSMPNSYDGRVLIAEIGGGESQQGENPSPDYPQEIKKTVISEIRTHDGNGNESVITLSQPIELYGNGNVQDVIKDGEVRRKLKKVVFDGDENWKTSSVLVGRYVIGLTDIKNFTHAICTQFIEGESGSTSVNEFWLNSPHQQIAFNTPFATLDEWKAHLQANPMTVVYERAEEVIEELPIADQIALNNLSTYDGITYIDFYSEIEPTFKGKYGTSEIGGMSLESLLTARNNDMRLTSLEASVVNNI